MSFFSAGMSLEDLECLETLKITDRKLGEGGFGSVSVCELSGKKVAAKKLSQSKKEFDNLSREASKLRRLRFGKYITYIYGIAMKEENLYMVMEYSEYGDLQNYLKKNKEAVTDEQKILFCRGILLGLLYCHSMKIFHGDIKGSNVLLGENLEPKLTDFGLSMTVDNIKGYSKTYEGSIHWAAPELFSMEDESDFEEFKANPYPTDVYSLGVTFCQVSFDGTTDFIDSDNIEMDISLGLVSPISKDGFLEEIIDGCCQFERTERISLDKCLSMLDAVAEGQLPIPAADDKWLGIQQDIKAKSKLEFPPSFILRRPTKNLVVGPSNLSLLEWLCINDCIKAVEYMIQLREPEKKQLKWLRDISVLCNSPNVVEFLQIKLQGTEAKLLRLSKLLDVNPWQLIEAFIKAGANCNEQGLSHEVIVRRYNKLVQLLVDNNFHNMGTAIHDAIKYRNIEAMEILTTGTQLEFRNEDGDTPLLAAINTGNIEIVEILLDRKVDVHSKNNLGQNNTEIKYKHTPLIRAAVKGNRHIMKLLIHAGATTDTEDNGWHLLTQDLERQGKSNIIEFIETSIKIKAMIAENDHSAVIPISNSGGNNGKSTEVISLRVAVRNGQSDLVQKLIGDGVNANEYAYDEYSPLHWAVIIGNVRTIRILLKAGADINSKTPNQEQNQYSPSSPNYFNEYTPLHIAIVKRHLRIAKLLIESGANFSLKDKAGQTIMDMAKKDDKEEIEGIIQKYVPVTEDSFQWILETMNMETARMLISSRDASMDTLNHFLCVAAHHGSTEATNYLLECGVNVNSGYKGKSPLEWAISGGHVQIVQILIDQGAVIHSKESKKHSSTCTIMTLENWPCGKKNKVDEAQSLSNSLLHQAAALNNVEIVEVLLNAGVDIDIRDNNGYNALYHAALYGCDEVVVLLHGKGAKVRLWEKAEDSDAIYRTAKHIVYKAVETGKINTEKIFTDAGVRVDFENKSDSALSHIVTLDKSETAAAPSSSNNVTSNTDLDKITTLTEAVKSNQLERVQLLLNAGAEVNTKSTHGATPLFECVEESLMHMVQLLIKNGADVNVRDKDGFAPIHCINDREIAEILIAHGADVNAKNIYGATPLFACVHQSLVDIVRLLIKKGADVNARDENGLAPINLAKNREIAEILITHGADVNTKRIDGRTPLFECVKKSLIDLVRLLIKNGADVNTRDEDGYFPIHIVKDREIAEILISHGADVNTKNTDGQTPLFECVSESLVDIVQILVEKGADVSVSGIFGFTPIHCVNDREIAEILIAHGADVNTKSANGLTPLFRCVRKSLIDTVQFLVEKGADVNARDQDGLAPIHLAKNTRIAEILIAHGADVNTKSTNGRTPLSECVEESLVDMVQFLVEKGADVNARTEDGFAPIHLAKDREIVEILIAHGVDVNAKKKYEETLLFACVEKSLVDMVQLLIRKRADVNVRNRNGFAPIHSVKDREIAEILIAHGADLNAKSKNGTTLLFRCVQESLMDMIQFLVEKGTNANTRTERGYTPIHIAKNTRIAEILISHGADVNAKDMVGLTPLFKCVEESLVDMVQLLTEKGADVNAGTEDGSAPIHLAEDREIAEILIAHGADLNAKSKNGITLLSKCVEKSLVDIVQLLVEKGADINVRTKDGFTPIHLAKNREIAEILIAHGADVNTKSTNGRTPLFECVDKSLIDMVRLLIEKGANVNARDEDGFAPIHYVTDKEIAEILISHDADVNIKGMNGQTPLFRCVDESLVGMVQFLIKKGADVNAGDERGFTPIHFVANKEIAEILIAHGADVNTKDIYGITPLSECVNRSLGDIAQLLIKNGADVNARGKYGYAPIHNVRSREVLKILIDNGANVNVKSEDGKTLFSILLEEQNRRLDCAQYNRKEASELLEYLRDLK